MSNPTPDQYDAELDMLTDPGLDFDQWNQQSFSTAIETALYLSAGCKMDPVCKKGRKQVRVSQQTLDRILSFGHYIPANEVFRMSSGSIYDFITGKLCLDLDIQDLPRLLPKKACVTLISDEPWITLDEWTDDNTGYHSLYYVEQLRGLPRGFRLKKGVEVLALYRVIQNNFFADNMASSIALVAGIDVHGNAFPVIYQAADGPMETDVFADTLITVLINWIERNLAGRWYVMCEDDIAKASFSVFQSQVKSLFYARSLPVSETNRKRPILHWVSSHQRRIREGVEVNVREHLRGADVFEMGGARYKILTPSKGVTLRVEKPHRTKGFG